MPIDTFHIVRSAKDILSDLLVAKGLILVPGDEFTVTQLGRVDFSHVGC